MQIIWILRKTSAQQHLFHSFSMEEKKQTKNKNENEKKSTLCLTICWTMSQSFGIWTAWLNRICRIHFLIAVPARHSIYLNLKLKLNPVHPFSIKAKLQPKERNKWSQSLQFCPRNMTRRTLYIRTRPEAAAPSSSESHQGQERQTDNTKWEQVLGRLASGEIPNVFCVRCECLTKSAESSTVRAVAGSSV